VFIGHEQVTRDAPRCDHQFRHIPCLTGRGDEWSDAVPYQTAILDLQFDAIKELRNYLLTLAGLLHSQVECRRTIDRQGRTGNGSSLKQLIENDQIFAIDYRLKFQLREDRFYLKPDSQHLRIQTSLLSNCQANELLWLQSNSTSPQRFPLIALPVNREGLTLDTLHALVVLASHTGKLVSARYENGQGQVSGCWTNARSGADSLPIRADVTELVWLVDPSLQGSLLWFTPSSSLTVPDTDHDWWQRLLNFRQNWPDSRDAIKAHVGRLLPDLPSSDHWELEELDSCEGASDSSVAVIQPQQTRVKVAIDPQLEDSKWGRVLLHSMAHLALGHLRPGDEIIHTDSMRSIVEPTRHRDLLASQLVSYWSKPGWWAPASLDDCTPEQKVKLGMWRILEERLGGSQLHEKARSYQPTAYQRQAATRLVDILDRYDGAILSDGVGLGKSYIATTVMVHYINTWLDSGDNVSGKRITIIAPNQVTSTWQNEALASIASWGARNVQIRVISHHTLSRGTQLLRDAFLGVSDLEHLVRSDLVVIDEAHAFRNKDTSRSRFLGNILRTRWPGADSRKILLLTATPVNNDLNDLYSLLKLLFAPVRETGALKELNVLFHKLPNQFREVFSGIGIVSLNDYLSEERTKVSNFVEQIGHALQNSGQPRQLSLLDVISTKNRIADQLLDQIVVQRSRSMCEEIEKTLGNVPDFRFRKQKGGVSKITYSASSPKYREVLNNMLKLFPAESTDESVSLSLNAWKSVVARRAVTVTTGLQRTQLLKRLESSFGSLLISYVRLVNKHLVRLKSFKHNAFIHGDAARSSQLDREIDQAFSSLSQDDQAKVRSLLGQDEAKDDLLDPRDFDRLWAELKEPILADFRRLLAKMPVLMDSILGDLDLSIWPKIRKNNTEWPEDSRWGLQILRDEKVSELVRYLLKARRKMQKVIIFSEFTDTIEYIKSILHAITLFSSADWNKLLADPAMNQYSREEILELIATTKDMTGNTPEQDQDRIICRFAPYYRIGPILADPNLREIWEDKWRDAITSPVNVLLANDILAEGVNLQDAAILINFDMHWNPVKLLQRSGRIDRRLNTSIEDNRDYPELARLARDLQKPLPAYYWHDHQNEAPQILNMQLPDELENNLRLIEKLWAKSVLIGLVLGFDVQSIISSDQYQFFDISGEVGINAIAGDRTIEQLLHYRDLLKRDLIDHGIDLSWAEELRGCFSSANGVSESDWIASVTVITEMEKLKKCYVSSWSDELSNDKDFNNQHVEALRSIASTFNGRKHQHRLSIVEQSLQEKIIELVSNIVPPDKMGARYTNYFRYQYSADKSGQSM
jgi:superfamily II DNA or RNA helicase